MTGGIIAGTTIAGVMTGGTIAAITVADATVRVARDTLQASTRGTVRSRHMSERRIFGASRGIAAGAAWLALSASAAAHALPPTDTGSAAVDTQSSAAQRGDERAGIDALIEHLHDSLKITAQQEPLWHGVTEAMRESAETMSRLAQQRAERAHHTQ
jgi:hypothetical protein